MNTHKITTDTLKALVPFIQKPDKIHSSEIKHFKHTGQRIYLVVTSINFDELAAIMAYITNEGLQMVISGHYNGYTRLDIFQPC
jgi:hypothetical protein